MLALPRPARATPRAMRMIDSAAKVATIRLVGFMTGRPDSVREPEDAVRQVDAQAVERLDELRTNAGRLEMALDRAVHDAGLLPQEDVLHDDDVAFHPLDLGDVGDPAGAVLEAGLMDDEVHGRGDLLA